MKNYPKKCTICNIDYIAIRETSKFCSLKCSSISQKGKKKAGDYPFGEDSLGNLENTSTPRKKPIKTSSPLSLESFSPKRSLKSMELLQLGDYLKKNDTIKKELLTESTEKTPTKSMMDESNILE